MKQVKQYFQRQLVASLTSITLAIVLLTTTHINLFIFFALVIGSYWTSNKFTLFIQQTKERKALGLSRSEYKYIQEQIIQARIKIRQLAASYGKVRSLAAAKQIQQLVATAKKLLAIVRENPGKFYQVEQFFYSHLDSAVQLTSKYAVLVNQPIEDREIQIALQSTRTTLGDLKKDFEQDLRNALASDLETLHVELHYIDAMNKKKQITHLEGDSTHDRKTTH